MATLTVRQPSQVIGDDLFGIGAFLKAKAQKEQAKFAKLRNRALEQELAFAGEKQNMARALNASTVNLRDVQAQRGRLLNDMDEELRNVNRQIKEATKEGLEAGVESADLKNLKERQAFINRKFEEEGLLGLGPSQAGELANQMLTQLGVDDKVRERSLPGLTQQFLDADAEASHVTEIESQKTAEFAAKLMADIQANPGLGPVAEKTFADNPEMMTAIRIAQEAGQRREASFIGPRGLERSRFLQNELLGQDTRVAILEGEFDAAERSVIATEDFKTKQERQVILDRKREELTAARRIGTDLRSAIGRLLPEVARRRGSVEPPAAKAKANPKEVTSADGAKFTIVGNEARDSRGVFFPFARTPSDERRMIASGEIKPGRQYITGDGEKRTAPGGKDRKQRVPVLGSRSNRLGESTPFDRSSGFRP